MQIGREQWGRGRWGFEGSVDELLVYGQALGEDEIVGLVKGTTPDGALLAWAMDEEPKGDTAIQVVDGKAGKAWKFSGGDACFLDCGTTRMPLAPVTVRVAEGSSRNACMEWSTELP